MNWQYVFNTAIAGLVMLSVARAVTIGYALTLHPRASMLNNATSTRFRTTKRYAEIGMKGALAALQFERLDNDADSAIDLADFVAIYARIQGVTFEQALAVSTLVMDASKEETKEMRKARAKLAMLSRRGGGKTEGEGESRTATQLSQPGASRNADSIDFGKFLLAREGGGMIPWSKYLLIAEEEAEALVKKVSAEQMLECRRSYEGALLAGEEKKIATEKLNVKGVASTLDPARAKALDAPKVKPLPVSTDLGALIV